MQLYREPGSESPASSTKLSTGFVEKPETQNLTGAYVKIVISHLPAMPPFGMMPLLFDPRHTEFFEDGSMKPEIHPEYSEINVVCSCGNSFKTRSTMGKDEMQVEVCAACHPFFTGKQKLMDTAGQVDKFRRRYGMK